MKKKIIPFILLPLLVGCSEDYYNSFSGQQGVTLSASLEQQNDDASATSRSVISSDSKVVWSTGDKISILSYSGSSNQNDEFTLKEGATTTSGTFSGTLSSASQYYALYPYSASASYDGTTNISFTIPQEQTYAENSFGIGANPAVAAFTSAADELKFKNLCGVLTLNLTGSGTLIKIDVTTKKTDEYLCGNYTLTATTAGTDGQTLTYVSGGSNTITLKCGTGIVLSYTAKEFNIVVPAGSFTEGFDITCYFSGGSKSLSTTKAQTIARSQKHVMATANVNGPMSFTLDNSSIKEYLDYVAAHPYSDTDWTTTYITNYDITDDDYNKKSRPLPATINWVKNSSSTKQYLTVSLNSDFSDPYYDNEEISNDVSTYDIYDLIPNRKYYYKVTAKVGENTETLLSSYFNTLGYRRYLYVWDVQNLRDFGGLATADGHVIKYGQLFRGGRANENNSTTALITDDGRKAAKRAGILAELDLRNDAEAGNITASPLASTSLSYNVVYRRIPAFPGYYGSINANTATCNIQELQYTIDQLRLGHPVYSHCAVGADREGTLSFMMAGLLGVPQNTLSIDYELTSFSTRAGLRTRTRDDFKALWTAINTVSGDEISGVTYPATVTTTFQRRFYNYYYNGITDSSGNNTKISQTDLDWFIDHMLETPQEIEWGNGYENEAVQEETPGWSWN